MNADVSSLHHRNERMNANTCVNKSLFEVLASSPVVLQLNNLESCHLSEAHGKNVAYYRHAL